MITGVKPPPASYVAHQNMLRNGLDRPDKSALESPISLRAWLRYSFQTAFSLTPDLNLASTEVLRLDSITSELGPCCRKLIDHLSYWKLGATKIVVTQPYVVLAESDANRLNPFKIEVVDLCAWTFHSPGRTSCYGLVLSVACQDFLCGRNPLAEPTAEQIFKRSC